MSTVSNAKTYVVLVNYKRAQDTLECLESLRALSEDVRTIVVDNASGGSDLRELRDKCETVIGLTENLGFAGGNNVGIAQALADGADFIWLLNNDTIVQEDTLSRMLETIRLDPQIGIVGSKIYYYHDRTRLWYVGATISKLGKARHTGLDELDTGQHGTSFRDVGYVTGCSMLVRREVIEDIGMLPEHYFMYYEDVEWSLRAQRAGWRTVVEPQSVLWHKEGASSGGKWRNPSAAQDYFDLRNGWLFLDRNSHGIWLVLGRAFLLVRFLRKIARMIIRREPQPLLKLRMQVVGLYHGWKGRTGPMPQG